MSTNPTQSRIRKPELPHLIAEVALPLNGPAVFGALDERAWFRDSAPQQSQDLLCEQDPNRGATDH
jgi:hypothetical protein